MNHWFFGESVGDSRRWDRFLSGLCACAAGAAPSGTSVGFESAGQSAVRPRNPWMGIGFALSIWRRLEGKFK